MASSEASAGPRTDSNLANGPGAVRTTPPPARTEPREAPASDKLDWSHFAFGLELDAIARQVALNCVVAEFDGQRLSLAHLPELELMLKPEIKNQIKASIENKLSVSLTLEFSATAALDVETPQQAQRRELEEDRLRAIGRIREHAMVRQLKQLFNAELVESSVRKHDTR